MSRYRSIKKIQDKQKTRIGTATLPERLINNGDTLLIATEGDRCDILADQFYGTPELWWFVALSNNLSTNNIPVGTQLRIPVTAENAVME